MCVSVLFAALGRAAAGLLAGLSIRNIPLSCELFPPSKLLEGWKGGFSFGLGSSSQRALPALVAFSPVALARAKARSFMKTAPCC